MFVKDRNADTYSWWMWNNHLF